MLPRLIGPLPFIRRGGGFLQRLLAFELTTLDYEIFMRLVDCADSRLLI